MSAANSYTSVNVKALRECVEFWTTYSSLNESGQDDLNEERHAWLNRMRGWADACNATSESEK